MLFIYFMILFFLPVNAHAAELTVKTQLEGGVLSDAEVMVWEKAPTIQKSAPNYRLKTDKSGTGKLIIDNGKYYVFAEKTDKTGYYFGFYGLNPIDIKKNQTINLSLVRYPKGYLKTSKGSGISGIVRYSGAPVKDVGVYAYLDLNSELKGPPYMLAATDEKGFFRMEPEAGSYYLFLKKKLKNAFGPPEPGDYVGFFPVFPVTVDRAGVHITAELLRIPDKMRESFKGENLYIISGVVMDMKKQPLKGMYVGAYEKPEVSGKPRYASSPTDAAGRFNIYIKEGGTYFIAARERLGDTPQTDEKVFIYGEVTMGDGEHKKEIEIVVSE